MLFVHKRPRDGDVTFEKSEVKDDMWNLADRVVKAVSDVTVGTVIVLVHVALADRSRRVTTPIRGRSANA